jgi:hypothetical protein
MTMSPRENINMVEQTAKQNPEYHRKFPLYIPAVAGT